jgi:hypothetical protein
MIHGYEINEMKCWIYGNKYDDDYTNKKERTIWKLDGLTDDAEDQLVTNTVEDGTTVACSILILP